MWKLTVDPLFGNPSIPQDQWYWLPPGSTASTAPMMIINLAPGSTVSIASVLITSTIVDLSPINSVDHLCVDHLYDNCWSLRINSVDCLCQSPLWWLSPGLTVLITSITIVDPPGSTVLNASLSIASKMIASIMIINWPPLQISTF